METIISSKNKKTIIGPNQPFVMIGERINPTRRKKLAESISQENFSVVQEDAIMQVKAGAQILDVNAGIPGGDEPKLLCGAIKAILDVVDVPLCIDTANPEALQAALEIYPGNALINSTTAEEHMMERIFPLAKKYGSVVIGVITDDNGVPVTPEARLAVARKLIKRASDFEIPSKDIIIDCLALTVSADSDAGRITLDTIRLVQQELGVNINLGASNVSFGLPDRKIINATYLSLAIARGMTVAITDPTVPEIRTALLACDLLMGRDAYAKYWIKAYRERSTEA